MDEPSRFKSDTDSLITEELARQLKTDLEEGVPQTDAEERLKTLGPNIIPKTQPNLFRTYIAPLSNWLIGIYLLISSALALFAFFVLPEVWGQVVQWLSIIAINSAIAIVQHARAQRKLEALQQLLTPTAVVLRDGRMAKIQSEKLVPGDIVRLEQGDRVPADARIVSSSSLRVNEAALTGESDELDKSQSFVELPDHEMRFSHPNMLYLGTYVTAGTAKALVVSTGGKTRLGMISRDLERLSVGEVPLHRKINKLAKYLGLAVIVYLGASITYHTASLYLSGNLFTKGALDIELLATTIVEILITSMSIMPINIPLLSTIVLAAGVLAMSKHQVVIRDLSAVESLGRVSVLCSDKTGTITMNQMTVKWICLPTVGGYGLLYGVTGGGFQHVGDILTADLEFGLEDRIREGPELLNGPQAPILPETALEHLLVSGVLNNDSIILDEANPGDTDRRVTYKVLGDITDASLLFLFRKSALDLGHYRSRFIEEISYPFDSSLKRMSRVFKDNIRGGHTVFMKGATETLIPRCSGVWRDEKGEQGPLDEHEKEKIESLVGLFASSGHRVISFAFRRLDSHPSEDIDERESIEDNMIYLGFVAIADPPREGVRESVLEAKDAGVRTLMMTGDSIETAKTVALQVGIIQQGDLAVKGSEIGDMSQDDFLRTSVFARVSPQDKMLIVDRYKREDRVIAMTGDGINDALAVSMADVGIAMGISGTDLTKQASDMVIADDSFNSVVTGIREGRGLFEKIRSIIFFFVAANLGEALIYFGSSLIPDFRLLSTWQQIYIFMTAHSLPPFALVLHRFGKDVMKEKPRDSEEIINNRLKIALLIFSVSLGLVFYLAYFGTLLGIVPVLQENKMGYTPSFQAGNLESPVSWAQAKARTMLHTVAFISECGLVISLRRINKPLSKNLREENQWRGLSFILLVPLAHLILMYVPTSQSLLVSSAGINLEVIRLAWTDWLAAFALASAPIMALEIYKNWLRKREQLL